MAACDACCDRQGGEFSVTLLLGDPAAPLGVSSVLGSLEVADAGEAKVKLLSAGHQPTSNVKPNIAHTFVSAPLARPEQQQACTRARAPVSRTLTLHAIACPAVACGAVCASAPAGQAAAGRGVPGIHGPGAGAAGAAPAGAGQPGRQPQGAAGGSSSSSGVQQGWVP